MEPITQFITEFLNIDLATLLIVLAPIQYLAGWISKNFPSVGKSRFYNVFMRIVDTMAQNTGMAANADRLTNAELAAADIARLRATKAAMERGARGGS